MKHKKGLRKWGAGEGRQEGELEGGIRRGKQEKVKHEVEGSRRLIDHQWLGLTLKNMVIFR